MPAKTDNCANVLGVNINAIDIEETINACDKLIARGKGYVCVTGVHGVMEAQGDAKFLSFLNGSFLSVPDGMPMVWVGRLQGFRSIHRVYGPDLMIELCRHSVERGYRHFFYGGKKGVAEELAANLLQRIPGLLIAGTYTPPFRQLTADEDRDLSAVVAACKPDIFWVGLSTPKQERFMAEHCNSLDVRLMIGVGAAFDVHTGRIKDAPKWMKSSGLQWLHRLFQEPKRLWKRYLVNNPKFVWRIALQLARVTRYSI